MPLVSQAMTQLGNEIWMAKYARCHALKVIHGYGSSGQGGAIKAACLLETKVNEILCKPSLME